LLGARRTNEAVANPIIELFEIAKIYLPKTAGLPDESLMLGLTGGGDFFALKGAVEAILASLKVQLPLEVRDLKHAFFTPGRATDLYLGGERIGVLGEVSQAARKEFDLRGTTTVAELRLVPLIDLAQLVPHYREVPATPAIRRDLNLEIKEQVHWSDVAAAVRTAAGAVLEQLDFKDVYRNDELTKQGEKRLLLSVTLRDSRATLTGGEADEVRDRIVAACGREFGARLQAS
jgi:phenylalanyl-tRNA synthetase beta chain